ncbi:helix-turn-helix domain-containing protein [Kushneria marisflavi]|uniref:Uncharacterized protein n=1 Tax=Kushneria marisflavi TaxID=157779 RepID=A0A240UKY6_9GAMM|nr:helix-turn-helix domain-containing protein [Kushneria marisflavi]ART62138.1 hypothetical protein B9H00_02825 [Kushneria marisflavi]RKD87218.1 XRE family transcriptional regulator [Kushneria marisflavi]
MDNHALQRLGHHLTTMRQQRAWSLSLLAEKAGIAKSSLSRLEQGQGNPTLDTLWRLALQLETPFSALIAETLGSVTDGNISISLLKRHHDALPVDIYLMTLAPNASRHAHPHAMGTRETIQVIGGSLQAGVEQAPLTLIIGEIHQFAADQPHLYRAGPTGATALVTIFYAKGDMT